MDAQRAGVPHRASRSSRRSRTSTSCASATERRRSRTRASGSTPTCSRPSSWASCSTWPRSWSSRRAGPQGVPRRPLPRGLPDPRRRQLHAAHHGLPRRGDPHSATRRPHPARLQAGRRHPLPADGAEVLMATADRSTRPTRPAAERRLRRLPSSRSPCAIRRFNPEVDGRAALGGLPASTIARRPTASSTPCTRSSGSRTAR